MKNADTGISQTAWLRGKFINQLRAAADTNIRPHLNKISQRSTDNKSQQSCKTASQSLRRMICQPQPNHPGSGGRLQATGGWLLNEMVVKVLLQDFQKTAEEWHNHKSLANHITRI